MDLFDEVLHRKDYQKIPEETEDQTDDRFVLFIKESTNLKPTFMNAGFPFQKYCCCVIPERFIYASELPESDDDDAIEAKEKIEQLVTASEEYQQSCRRSSQEI